MNNKSDKWIYLAIILIGLGLLILICIFGYLGFYQHEFHTWTEIDLEKGRNLATMLTGFVGLFWSLAGVVLIYGTFQSQKADAKLRHVETIIFQMFGQLNDIIANTKGEIYRNWIDLHPDNYPHEEALKDFSGLDYFSTILKKFFNLPDSEYSYIKLKSKFPNINDQELNVHGHIQIKIEYTISEYEIVFDLYHSRLGHFYRYLFNIFKFIIGNKDLDENEKQKYINLIQAQLSDDILGLIFYNALSKYGRDSEGNNTFYTWLDHYRFFENIKKESLRHDYDHWRYPQTIFKFLTQQEKEEKRRRLAENKN